MADPLHLLPNVHPARLTSKLEIPHTESDNDVELNTLIKYKAASGDAAAELDLARAHNYGHNGNEVDIDRARELFERHPEDPNAMVHLGRIYHIGQGVPVDQNQARVYYEAAAALNDLNGLNNLGILKQAMGDVAGGAELINRAAAAGHQTAIFNMAVANITKGHSADAIAPLRNLARQNFIIAQYNLARLLILGVGGYDPQEAIETLTMSIERGPWLRLCQTAEELWKDGRRRAAVLLWIDLADGGIPAAAFNAGLALLEGDARLIGSEEDGLRIAAEMFKRLAKREDVSGYLAKVYRRRNKTQKATDKLVHMAASARGHYGIVEAYLGGHIEFKICPLFGNLSLAVEKERRFLLPEIFLAPKILWLTVKRAMRCIQGQCNQEELDDFSGALQAVCTKNRNGIISLLILLCTVILVRKRAAMLYNW
jgi:TPR repeat protein